MIYISLKQNLTDQTFQKKFQQISSGPCNYLWQAENKKEKTFTFADALIVYAEFSPHLFT